MIQFLGFCSDPVLSLPIASVGYTSNSVSADSSNQWKSFNNERIALQWRDILFVEDGFKMDNSLYSDLNIVLLAGSRLDNKADLGRMLHLSEEDPDRFFIAEAYRKWGKQCVAYLLGDWFFALWDNTTKELFVARDHCGNTGLFYYQCNHFFAFSSDIRQLILLEQIPKRVNELFVMKTLVSWPNEGASTAYEGIFRLPPGHYIEVKNKKIKITRYYFLEETPPVLFKQDNEYFEQFLYLYTQSVKSCLQGSGPVASTLSGGLDSGSVSVLAARELARKGLMLQSYTSVPLYTIDELALRNRFGDEHLFVQKDVDFSGNININYINAKDISLIAGIKNHLISHAEPGHAAGNYYWIQAILEQAQKDGIKTFLTGQCGNGTVSWMGYPESQENGSWIKDTHSVSIFFKQLVKKLIYKQIPYSVINFYRHLGLEKDPWFSYSAISKSVSDHMDIRTRMKQEGHDPHFLNSKTPLETRFNIIKPGKSPIGSFWQTNGAQYGMEIRDPTMGKELTEFCIGVPDRIYRNADQDRYLMRKAMEGLLPDEVRLNKKRGLQGADNLYRVRAEATEISAVLDSLKKSDLANQFLDLSKMNTVFNSSLSENSLKTLNNVGAILLRGIDTGLFLKSFEEKYT